MEKTIFGHSLSLDTAPVHVAPGGSVIYRLSGGTANIAELLRSLREEIAYGMIDVSTLSESDKTVEVAIYMGKADVDSLTDILGPDIAHTVRELAEDAVMTGFSMRARNLVIDTLGKV